LDTPTPSQISRGDKPPLLPRPLNCLHMSYTFTQRHKRLTEHGKTDEW
jgi:hypothetical protein